MFLLHDRAVLPFAEFSTRRIAGPTGRYIQKLGVTPHTMAARARKKTPSLIREPAVTVTRASMRKDELVYVLVADKKIRYSSRRSRVVYIGMTESGVHRVAKSAADRAERILDESGIHSFSARIVHYPAIDGRVERAWKKRPALLLERALLIAFREEYGEMPLCNGTGAKMRPDFGEFEKFSLARLKTLLEDLE